MAKSAAVVLTQTPARLSAVEEYVNGQRIEFVNDTGVAVILGGSDVTVANGRSVAAAATYTCDLEPGEHIFAIVAAATQTLKVLRLGTPA